MAAPARREDGFNKTDQEKAMADHVWRFLHAPHVTGWFIASLPDEDRASSIEDRAFELGRYYRWLQKTNYRSSRVRYQTVAGDIAADIATLPSTFEAVCAVENVDRQRQIALADLGPLEPGMAQRVEERHAENEATIARFAAAVNFRYESYSYALENLLVETPHEEAVEVDGLLKELSGFVRRARGDDFCGRTLASQIVLPS